MSRIRVTNFGVAIIDGDTHLSKWIEQTGKLDCEDQANRIASQYIKIGDVVVDAGASLGDHTLSYLKAVGTTGVVYAIEPNPEAFACLKHNCPKAICLQKGLGCEPKIMSVFPNENIGASQLRDLTPGMQEAEIITLDSLCLKRLDYIKIDVEGMELDVMRGGIETIKRFHPIMLVELNDNTLFRYGHNRHTIIEYILPFGYRLVTEGLYCSPDMTQADVLFIPISK